MFPEQFDGTAQARPIFRVVQRDIGAPAHGVKFGHDRMAFVAITHEPLSDCPSIHNLHLES